MQAIIAYNATPHPHLSRTNQQAVASDPDSAGPRYSHYPQKIGRRINPSGKAEGALMPVREDSSEYQHTGKITLNGLIKGPM